MENILANIDIAEVLKYAAIILVLIGIKMKWWTKSDFKQAKEIVEGGLEQAKGLQTLAKEVALKTKFSEKKALPLVIDLVHSKERKDKGVKDTTRKKLNRGARKFLWSFFEGGL